MSSTFAPTYSLKDIHTFYVWTCEDGRYFINRRGDVLSQEGEWLGQYDGTSINYTREPEFSTDFLVLEEGRRNWVPPAAPGGLATLVAPAPAVPAPAPTPAAPRRSARLAAKPLKRYISPWTEWRRATCAKTRELRSAATASPAAPVLTAAPPPRRSARLAAKAALPMDAWNRSYYTVRNTLAWYLDNLESSQSRDVKVFWASSCFDYVIQKLTGRYRVESFIHAVQNSERLRNVLTDRCHGIIRDIAVQPSSNKKLNQALIKNCQTLLAILTEMNLKAISQPK